MKLSLFPPDPRESIGARVFLLVGIGVLVPMLVVGGISAGSLDRLRQQILSDRQDWVRALAERLDDSVRTDLEALQQVASQPGFDARAPLGPAERQALRTAWLRFHSSDVVFLLDGKGRVLHVEPTNESTLAPEVTEAARRALATGTPLVTGALLGLSGRRRVYALVPVRDWQLQSVAVVGLGSEMGGTRLTQLVAAARPGGGGSADLLDADGDVLATTAPVSREEIAGHLPMVRDLLRRHQSAVGTCAGCHERGPAASHHEILASAALRTAPWVVRIHQPETSAMALARHTPRRILAVAGIVFVLALGFAFGIARSVRQPLAVLDSAAGAIAQGRLDRAIPNLGDDEIGRLGRALEGMREALRRSVTGLEHARSELEDRVRDRTAELAAANEELRIREEERLQLLRKVISAEEDERRRIARELHDETSQVLAALMLRIDTSLKQLSEGAPRQALEEVRSMAVRALDEVHRLVLDLRPSVLDDLGLQSAIRWIAERHLAPKGISSRCEFDIPQRLPPELETCFFRVAQEAITNVARHAEASSVLIQLDQHDRLVTLEIEDDGQGFDVARVSRPDAQRVSFGLLGMRERIELLGGTLTIDSAPGEGTRIAASVPVSEEA